MLNFSKQTAGPYELHCRIKPNTCNGMAGVNRNTCVPKSVLRYVLDKVHVL